MSDIREAFDGDDVSKKNIALRPFAEYASSNPYIRSPITPDHGAPANTPHNVGEYRRARAALAEKEPKC